MGKARMDVVKFIDHLLNKITMYRLIMYYLAGLLLLIIVLSAVSIIQFNTIDIIMSSAYLLVACYVFNFLLAKIFKVIPNFESQFITGLILSLIIGPNSLISSYILLTAAAFFAMASKYLLVYKKQHFFNPAAFGVVGTALVMGDGASWWVGGQMLLPFIVLGGLLIVRKTNRFHLVLSYFITYCIGICILTPNYYTAAGFQSFLADTFLSPVHLFFVFIMLTEPITSPADRKARIYFGIFSAVVYLLLSKFTHLFYALELSLLVGNVFGRIIRFSNKYELRLQSKKEIGGGLWEFLFKPNQTFAFIPGQYLEWQLPHKHADERGTRRYFTIASSPKEHDILLAVKVPPKASSYKKALMNLQSGDTLSITNLEGEFVLNSKVKKSYVFIAGGIGITPFRSMIQSLLDTNTKLPITLFYMARTTEEFVFKDIFDKAHKQLDINVVYIPSEKPPQGWKGETGRLTQAIVKDHVPDYTDRLYYLSGPQAMVESYTDLLHNIGVPLGNVKIDFFPGYDE